MKLRKRIVFKVAFAGNYYQRFGSGIAGGDGLPADMLETCKLAVGIVAGRCARKSDGNFPVYVSAGVVVVLQFANCKTISNENPGSVFQPSRGRKSERHPIFLQL